MGKVYYCKQCGKELKRRYKHELCQKHWEEKCRYGECISDTQMCEDDPSEIRIVDGIGRISLYNVLFEDTYLVPSIRIDIDNSPDMFSNCLVLNTKSKHFSVVFQFPITYVRVLIAVKGLSL